MIQFLKQQSVDSITIGKAATRVGQQQNEELWILGDGVHISASGELIPPDEQSHIWLDWSVEERLGNISMKEVLPTILLSIPQSFTEPLASYVQ